MKKIIKKNKKYIGGFTLVEVLVALSIFSLSVIAMISVLGSGISSTNYAKNKTSASYLAQEGIEYVRNMRDTFVLYSSGGSNGWDDFKSKLILVSCDTTTGCSYDDQNLIYSNPSNKAITNIPFTACLESGCPAVSENSNFRRKIRIQVLGDSGDEIQVFSTVSWRQGSVDHSVSFSESLFNWIKQ